MREVVEATQVSVVRQLRLFLRRALTGSCWLRWRAVGPSAGAGFSRAGLLYVQGEVWLFRRAPPLPVLRPRRVLELLREGLRCADGLRVRSWRVVGVWHVARDDMHRVDGTPCERS